MYLVKLTLLTLFFFPVFSALAQTGSTPAEQAYVKIRLKNLSTWEQVTEIDQFIRSQEGVKISRTDNNTGIFLAYYETASGLVPDDFVNWIQSLGYQTGCVVSGERDGQRLKEFPKECLIITSEEHALPASRQE